MSYWQNTTPFNGGAGGYYQQQPPQPQYQQPYQQPPYQQPPYQQPPYQQPPYQQPPYPQNLTPQPQYPYPYNQPPPPSPRPPSQQPPYYPQEPPRAPPSPYPASNGNSGNNRPTPPPPPQSSQSFGHGAPSSYRFKYSNCSGRRRALLVGINYFGQGRPLKGCINDVARMSTFLNQRYGYRREDMVILTDDQANPMSHPTKANMIRAMQWLVSGAQPNDSLFFHFSGTPSIIAQFLSRLYPAMIPGFDEVIYPVDFQTAGHIVDDDMHAIMVRPLQPGVRLTAIFDSCHSGTALDLPFQYSTQGVLKEPNLAKETALDLLSAFKSYESGDIRGVANTTIGLFKKLTIGDSARQKTLRTKTSPADVIMFSGSKDTQTSADTVEGGSAQGAMSWAFQEALSKNPKQSYIQLLNSIRAELSGKYSQKPQLSCSHPLGKLLSGFGLNPG
ncbi:WW domain protein [Trichophyton verrucosum HKI 0517]|uniref:Metacaspase-1B n=1 Tax=Trichophyton verrucosum (strain HKI 0517) TaxID=663202 RepID=D4D6H7_TRIVH|nr:WW domain protein [Trichophyton verrucosum HKI 0517]EFE42562.1 WW domain protein [Trichophyton verrucosum HKI 0517]